MPPSDDVIVIDSPLGRVAIHCDSEAVTAIDLRVRQAVTARPVKTRILAECKQALQRYFRNAQTDFDIALNLQGTPFQQRVWRALRQIPAGEVRTYGEVARQLKSSARAVGNACRANPVPIIIPCHRVVAAAGIGGYAGKTSGQELVTKTFLLHHEGVVV